MIEQPNSWAVICLAYLQRGGKFWYLNLSHTNFPQLKLARFNVRSTWRSQHKGMTLAIVQVHIYLRAFPDATLRFFCVPPANSSPRHFELAWLNSVKHAAMSLTARAHNSFCPSSAPNEHPHHFKLSKSLRFSRPVSPPCLKLVIESLLLLNVCGSFPLPSTRLHSGWIPFHQASHSTPKEIGSRISGGSVYFEFDTIIHLVTIGGRNSLFCKRNWDKRGQYSFIDKEHTYRSHFF